MANYYKQGLDSSLNVGPASQKPVLISGGEDDTSPLISFVKISAIALGAMWVIGHVPDVKPKASTRKPWWRY